METGISDSHMEMVRRSLTSPGNNYRMKKAIEMSKSGEEVTIVFLGASITMLRSELNDRGYATLSARYYANKFSSPDKIRYINSGMNGTSSTIGLIRVDRDVLAYQPDIVFVEFAVNDSKESQSREIFESLILRLLNSETKPAVVLLFMSSEGGYTCQGHMQVIGEYYQLPMISVCDAVLQEVASGRMNWSYYADDNLHPNETGNRLVAEFVNFLFDTADTAPMDEEFALPKQPFFGASYVTMKQLDRANGDGVVTGGSFQEQQVIKEFKNGWFHSASSGNKGMKLKLICKSLFAVYKENNDNNEGSAQIYVDGQLKATMSGYRIFGWGNPMSMFVFREEDSREHTIEVRMSPGDDKKEFNLLAFGYCD